MVFIKERNGDLKIGTLKPGESKTIKVSYTITAADVREGDVTNAVTANGIVPDTKEDVPGEDDVTVPTGRPPRDRDNEPTEDTDEPIDDGDTPLAPAEEEPIDDGDTPLAPAEEEPDEPIEEEPTPFSPYTGDDRHTAVWGFVSLLSLAGIVAVARKRREEE